MKEMLKELDLQKDQNDSICKEVVRLKAKIETNKVLEIKTLSLPFSRHILSISVLKIMPSCL